jgi:hypothetical protein
MKVFPFLTAGVAGTALMTLFSEAISTAKRHNYNEAKLLGKLLDRVTPLNARQSEVGGWIGHFAVGIAFAGIYAAGLETTKSRPNALNGLSYGALSGLAGAIIWHSTFKAHPNPPGVDFKNYYKQLVLAHVVFGLTAAAVLRKTGNLQNAT